MESASTRWLPPKCRDAVVTETRTVPPPDVGPPDTCAPSVLMTTVAVAPNCMSRSSDTPVRRSSSSTDCAASASTTDTIRSREAATAPRIENRAPAGSLAWCVDRRCAETDDIFAERNLSLSLDTVCRVWSSAMAAPFEKPAGSPTVTMAQPPATAHRTGAPP